MKTCVSTYSFGGYVSSLGIYGVIDKTAEMGFDGIEFVDAAWTENLSIDVAKKVRAYAEEKGLEIVSLCMGADLLNDGPEARAAEVQRLCRAVDFASALGVKNMRHDVTWKRPRASYESLIPILADGCRKVTEYAKEKGVGTMTENHGQFSQDSNRVEALCNAVNDPNFGLLVDVGNFLCADEEPTRAVGVTAPYAKHVHVKDFHFRSGSLRNPGRGWFGTRSGNYLRGAILGHGVVPVEQCLRILKNNGYDGFVSIEFEGVEDNLLGISWGLDNLKAIIGSI